MATELQRKAWVARAAYLGADAGASVTPTLSTEEAQQVLANTTEVGDVVRMPDLSGEWVDDLTPEALALEIVGDAAIGDDDLAQELAEAWEAGVDVTFVPTVLAFARRLLGEIPSALYFESLVEELTGDLRSDAEGAAAVLAELDTMRAAVARGVELLDDFAAEDGTIPNAWREVPYWYQLNMEDGCGCVLGQIWGRAVDAEQDYFDALNDLGLTTDDARAYGFAVHTDENEGALYAALADVWREAVGA